MPIIPDSLRKAVAERAFGLCEYCRYPEEFNSGRFAVDHIIPQSKGGSSDLLNLALACRSCNERKQDVTAAPDPATGIPVRLFNPREDQWEDHFAWSSDFSLMIGLTDVGRATIARLQTNHKGVVRQRQVLSELGIHPQDVGRLGSHTPSIIEGGGCAEAPETTP